MEQVSHDHPVGIPFGHLPRHPANQAVDGILLGRVVERELVPPSVELVAAVLDPVGPRDQHLAPPRAAHPVERIAVEQIAARPGVLSEAAPDLDDHGPLVGVRELDLVPARRDRGSARWSSRRCFQPGGARATGGSPAAYPGFFYSSTSSASSRSAVLVLASTWRPSAVAR